MTEWGFQAKLPTCKRPPRRLRSRTGRPPRRALYASAAIEGTSLSEEQALEIAREFYASGEPERIAALPTHTGMSYEEIVAEFQHAGLLKG